MAGQAQRMTMRQYPGARQSNRDPGAPPLIACPRCGWSSLHYGALIRLHREWRQWTVTYCAEQIGLTVSAWSQWERGARLPSQRALDRVARLFRLSETDTEELAQAAGLRLLPTAPGYRGA